MTPPVGRVVWTPCWRIIPSRFPPIQLFERVADPAVLEAVFELEALTNPRLRDETGDIRLVPPEDRVSGPGSSIVMAAFTHLNPDGSRFSDGSYGVYYTGRDLETAVAETRHHRSRFMAATAEPPTELDMRVYVADLDGALHDVRCSASTDAARHAALHDPDDYAASQHLGGALRRSGSDGVVYDSVRHSGGACAAVFRPPLLSNPRQERHLCYVWDGTRIDMVYEKRELGGRA